MDERTLKDQGQILDAVVSVAEVLAYLAQDRFLTLTQSAEYLAMSTRTIRDRLDEIPHYRVSSKLLLFKRSELAEWMSQYREGGHAELDELVDDTLASVLGKR